MRRAWPIVMILLAALAAWPQVSSAPVERTYATSIERVKAALQQAGASSGGKLPGLDGFVPNDLDQADHYRRPYYQFHIETSVVDAGHILVRAQARINAWYEDDVPSKSEYRSVPSNGRLETDLLDRLQDALGLSPATASPAPANISSAGIGTGSDEAALLQRELEKLREERRALEAKSNDIAAQVTQLNLAIRQQKSVADFAVVKRSGASIMSRMSFAGPVLFRAREEDEFEPLAQEGEWIQIHTGNDSTGWILADELTLPKGLVLSKPKEIVPAQAAMTDSTKQADGATSEPEQSNLGFWISREEVNAFSGEWQQLKGKKALFVFVQSKGLLTDFAADDRKLVFSKNVFTGRYKNASNGSAPYEGVVVIFMGGKAAVAAATVADIRDWAGKKLSEEAFIKRCSLDPLTEFQGWNTPKPNAK